jgi:Dolichyl-phosphate-mannose-protein mannosyltransferase
MSQITDTLAPLGSPLPAHAPRRGIVPVFAEPLGIIPEAGDPRRWPEGRLPRLAEPEGAGMQLAYLALAIVVIVGFFVTAKAFWVPAHPGADQNGYLVGGKLLAEGKFGGLAPSDPYEFVGPMWVATARETYYPKYPAGLPAIYAGCLKLFGEHGTTAAYLVSPILASLALLGVFLLIRGLFGSFAGLIGMLAMAASPDTLDLAINPNSHATTLFCVVWGFYFLLAWWRRRGAWRAVIGAFLIGFAVTVRYSEGLLLLPVVLIVLFNLRWNRIGDYVVSLLTLAAWAAPVGGLLWYNRKFLGTWTGYDSTHESTGFAIKYFLTNWDVLLRTLSTSGLSFLFSLATAGAVLLYRQSWRLGLVVTSWIVPSTLLYASYYWAPDNTAALSYGRFFLTILPPLIACAIFFILRAGMLPKPASPLAPPDVRLRWTRLSMIAAGVVVALGSAVDAESATQLLARDQLTNLNLLTATRMVHDNIPAGATIFGDDNLLRELQFVGDWKLYDYRLFTRAYVDRLGRVDPDDPSPLQFQRSRALYDKLAGKSDGQLFNDQIDLIAAAVSSGQKVYLVLPPRLSNNVTRRTDATRRLEAQVVATWDDLIGPAASRKGQPAKPPRPRRGALDRSDDTWEIVRIKLHGDDEKDAR